MAEVVFVTPKTLIVTDNVIEAQDLTEILLEFGFGPVTHVRQLNGARDLVEKDGKGLELIIFGLSLHVADTRNFVQSIAFGGCALVVIDGRSDAPELNGAAVLLRPFSTDDVRTAMARLGLVD